MSEPSKTQLKHLPTASLREAQNALRAVDREAPDYIDLVSSVQQVGILLPITVRAMTDPESNQRYYSVIDGLHRYTAAKDCGLESVPCHILTMDECQVLEAQLMANVHKIETKPAELAKQLDKILTHNPTMTAAELSVKLGKSPTWCGKLLGLVKLAFSIQSLVDEGAINLTNAGALAKLPPDEQKDWVERAMTMTPAEFTGNVNQRVKELRDAKREGRAASPTGYVPVEHLRKLSELKAELANPEAGPELIREGGLQTPTDVWAACLSWVLQVDPYSLAAGQAKHDARIAEQEFNKEKRAQEREAQKALKAAQAQEQLQVA